MILVTGASGFVGGAIMRLCEGAVACPSLRGLSEEAIRRTLADFEFDTIVHTAAIADIGICENDPEASYRANVLLPLWIQAAAPHAKLICFSSDQVYSGTAADGPYTEADANPANVYATHKLEMEQRVLDRDPTAVMLRAEWMYDRVSAKPNYFTTMLEASEAAFSSRQFRGITYVKEVAQQMPAVARLPGGVYNFGSETSKSMFALTRDFLAALGRDIPLSDAPARHNLWMNCQKAARHGVTFLPAEDALLRCAADHGLL